MNVILCFKLGLRNGQKYAGYLRLATCCFIRIATNYLQLWCRDGTRRPSLLGKPTATFIFECVCHQLGMYIDKKVYSLITHFPATTVLFFLQGIIAYLRFQNDELQARAMVKTLMRLTSISWGHSIMDNGNSIIALARTVHSDSHS